MTFFQVLPFGTIISIKRSESGVVLLVLTKKLNKKNYFKLFLIF